MKLQEFFDTQKHTNFTDVDKLDLYQSFLYKKSKKTSFKRFSFVRAKHLVYSVIFMFLMAGMYGVYFFNNGNLEDYNWFSIKSNITNTAQADYIAQVIDVKGNFSIEHDGVLTNTNNIGNGDTILLKEGAQLAFEIASGGTQSKIIGPAKLIIQKTHDENYKLNLIYGNFIQMEGNEWKTQTIELAINDITIKQQDKSQPLNFKFVQEGNKQIFQNNGANILVTKSNGENKTTTLSKQQVVAIQNNDIKIFANINTFTKAIQEKNISQTFSLTEEANMGSGDEEKVSLLSLLDTTDVKEEVTKEISSVLTDEKKILDPDQDEKISSSLDKGAYMGELKTLEGAFIEGNDMLFDATYSKLEKRVRTIAQGFRLSFTPVTGDPTTRVQGLVTSIKTLRDNINKEYNIPPTYIENFQAIEGSLENIIAKGYKSTATKDIPTQEKTQE